MTLYLVETLKLEAQDAAKLADSNSNHSRTWWLGRKSGLDFALSLLTK